MRAALRREPQFENEPTSIREALAALSKRMRAALRREPETVFNPRNSCKFFKTNARGAKARAASSPRRGNNASGEGSVVLWPAGVRDVRFTMLIRVVGLGERDYTSRAALSGKEFEAQDPRVKAGAPEVSAARLSALGFGVGRGGSDGEVRVPVGR
eukprot:8678757-Pyramimonas_sp.AAC.1